MRLVSLKVKDFGCVKEANVRFGPGLNVLFGPNDLGKSSLAEAIRFALLLQHSSSHSDSVTPWSSDATPQVELEFQTEPQRFWRIRKSFGLGRRGSSVFEFSKDGESYSVEAKARAVDAEIRKRLRWGISEPGGRGGPRGLPESFLTTVLLARQQGVSKLFGGSLGDDDDESGRSSIAEALQAAAQDPLFTKVIERTQREVDKAFTPTGRYRTGRASPFSQIKDQIGQAEREANDLEGRVLESQETRDRVRELAEQSVFEEQEQQSAKLALDQIDAVLEKNTQIADALDEVARIDALHDVARKVAEAQKMAAAEAAACLEKFESAEREVGAFGTQVAEAKDEISLIKSGQDSAARLANQHELEKELSAAVVDIERTESRARAAGGVKELDEAAESTSSELEALELTIEAKQAEVAGHDQSVVDAEKELQTLRGVTLWLRRNELQSRVDRGLEAAQRKTQLEGQVADAEARAQALEQSGSVNRLPSKDQFVEFMRLERALQLAEARLDVCVNVSFEPANALEVEIAGKRERLPAGETSSFDGTGELTFELVNLAKVRVRAGSAEARQELDESRGSYQSVVGPALKLAKKASLDELGRALETAAAKTAEGAALRASAASLREQLQTLDDMKENAAALADRLGEIKVQFDGYRDEALDERVKAIGPAKMTAIETEIATCERLAESANARRIELEKTIAASDATRRSLKARLKEVTTAREDKARELDSPWAEILASAGKRTGELTAKVKRISSEIDALASSEKTELKNAEERLEKASLDEAAARAMVSERRGLYETKKKLVDELAGEVRIRRQAADADDREVAKSAAGKLTSERDALPRPESIKTVTAQVREAAAGRLDEAARSLGRVRGELQNAKGGLAQVGGEVVRERRDGAFAALKRFREAERNLELEYKAWKLLLETLKEAERTQATHLGQSMVEPITKRFAELTASRYGELALGPELEIGGIEAAGATRDVEQLSVGTREQLSTVFRLSLAEELKSAVLLDDQLTQTDAKRMNWFKQRLREFAPKIQIIVLTCRPEDYLGTNEIPADDEYYDGEHVRAINLERVIGRT